MTHRQSPVSSSLVTLKYREHWSGYQLNSWVIKLSPTSCTTIQAIKQVWIHSCSLEVQLIPNQKAS